MFNIYKEFLRAVPNILIIKILRAPLFLGQSSRDTDKNIHSCFEEFEVKK